MDELESGITGRPETSWDEYGTSRDEYQERDNETSTDSGNPAPAVLSDEARAEALERTRRWLTDQGKGLGLSERQAQERAALIVSGFAAPPPSVLYDDDADSGGLDETDGGGH